MSAYDFLHSAYQELGSKKAKVQHEQRLALEKIMAEMRAEVSILVARAIDDEGHSIADVCRELPTSSRNTVYALRDEGREHRKAQPHVSEVIPEVTDVRQAMFIRNEGNFGLYWTVPTSTGTEEIIWDDIEGVWVDNITGAPIDKSVDIPRFEAYLAEMGLDKA